MRTREDRFLFRPELGRRLRQLRRRAGLTLRQMAHLMRRPPGQVSRLCRLENGRLRYPTLALVADYLRACRASFADISDILDQYTAQPVPLDLEGRHRALKVIGSLPPKDARRVDRFDTKTAAARRSEGRPPLEPDERELRTRKQAQAWLERGRLDNVLNAEMDNLGVMPMVVVRKAAFDHGHRLWRILRTTRESPGQVRRPDSRRKGREQRLAEAEARALGQAVIPLEGLRLIRQKTEELFRMMEMGTGFDALPTLDQARQVPRPLSARFSRQKAGSAGSPADSLPYDPRVLYPIQAETGHELTRLGLAGDRFVRYFNWLFQLQPIGLETGPDSEERRARTERLASQTQDPDLSRQVAAAYFRVFERWRKRLFRLAWPAAPGPGPGS